jgi:homoserine O-acetyltransferase/O-succinyltransferase
MARSGYYALVYVGEDGAMKMAARILILTVAAMALILGDAPRARAQTDFRKTAMEGDFIARDFHFHNGEILAELKIHYVTWGTPRKSAAGEITNAVLLLHGTGGAGMNFAGDGGPRAKPLLGSAGAVDTTIFYVIAPDAIGSGHSSKPSDGLRQKFPHYNLEDVAAAEKLLIESLGVHHLALVTGVSLGGRRTWQWGVQYPDFMDALAPMISSPKPNAGRRGMIDFLVEAIVRNDPGFENGNYKANPNSMALATTMYDMWLSGAGGLQERYPTREAVAKAFADMETPSTDANDFIYQMRMNDGFDAWSQLDRVRAPMLIINMAGDLMVPAELGDAKAAAARLKDATYLEVAEGRELGHGGLMPTMAVWEPKMRAWLEAHEPLNFSH